MKNYMPGYITASSLLLQHPRLLSYYIRAHVFLSIFSPKGGSPKHSIHVMLLRFLSLSLSQFLEPIVAQELQ